jgi:hypothetical protein
MGHAMARKRIRKNKGNSGKGREIRAFPASVQVLP